MCDWNRLKINKQLLSFSNGLLILPPGLKNGVDYPFGSLKLRFLRFDAPEDAMGELEELARLERLGMLPCHHVVEVMPLQPVGGPYHQLVP